MELCVFILCATVHPVEASKSRDTAHSPMALKLYPIDQCFVLSSFSAYFNPKWFQWQASLTSAAIMCFAAASVSSWIADSGVRKASGTRCCSASSWLLRKRAWKRCDLLCIAGAGNLSHLETGHFSSDSIRNMKAGPANQSDDILPGILEEQSLFWFVMEGLLLGGVTLQPCSFQAVIWGSAVKEGLGEPW